MNWPAGTQYGLMAKEVEKILPGLAKETQFDVSKLKAAKPEDGKGAKMPSPPGQGRKNRF